MKNVVCSSLLRVSPFILLVWMGGAIGQIVGSQHDLTVGGTAQGNTANTDQVCVFCHTTRLRHQRTGSVVE